MMTTRVLAVLASLLIGLEPVLAADNSIIVTPGTGVTLRSKDVGGGVESLMQILGDTAGNPLATAPGTGNTSFALPMQGVAGGVALPVSGTVTANAGTNLNTSALALETGGNLAQIVTDFGAPGATACASDTASCSNNQLMQRLAQRLTTINTTLGTPLQAGGSVNPSTIATWGLMSGTTPGTAPTNTLIGGGIYNSSPPSPTSGQTLPLQLDSSGYLDVNVKTATGLAQASTTSGQTGSLVMGAVTTSAPSYTTAQTDPLSIDTAGGLRASPATPANWGIVATAAAPPANAVYLGANASGATGGHVIGLINCDSHVFKHITSATDTLAVQGVASQTVYVCA